MDINFVEYEKGILALEVLAAVVSGSLERSKRGSNERLTKSGSGGKRYDHRVSCHRCGNIRKRKVICSNPQCPHIFCGRCADKFEEEFGKKVFHDGCPFCKSLCCCSNKSPTCTRFVLHHFLIRGLCFSTLYHHFR